MYYQQWGKKYKNINQVYNDIRYDSKLEANYAKELDLRLKAKDIKGWDRQKTLELKVNGEIVCRYRIDFVVYHFDKTTEYVEVKGMELPLWKLKWKILNAMWRKQLNNGTIKLTIIK